MIGWRMMSRVLGLLSTLVLARVLVPADFGLVAMATAYAASIEAVSQIGVLDALIRDGRTNRDLYDTAFTLNATRGLLTAAAIVLTAPVVASFFGEPRLAPVLLPLAMNFAAQGFENVGAVEFRRELAFGRQFQLLLLPRVLQVAVTVAFALTLRSYWALVWGLVTGRLATLLASYVLHPYRPRLSLSAWRDIAGFSAWSWVAALARLVWNRMDAFVIGAQLGPAQLGAYLAGSELALLPASELVAPIAEVLFPGFARARTQDAQSLPAVPSVILGLIILIFPVAAAISAGANGVVAVMLGPQWGHAQPVVAVLAWLCVVQPVSYVTWVYLVAMGHIRRDVEVMAAASAAKLPALLIGASTGQLHGVALAVLLAGVLESALFAVQLGRTLPLPIRSLMGAALRLVVAGGLTAAGLATTGLGWNQGAPSFLAGLAECVGLLVLSALMFWATLLSLWVVWGRPDGPEQLLLNNAHRVLARFGQPLRRRANS